MIKKWLGLPLSSHYKIAIFIAFLFHFCGAIGILFSPYKDWFISKTYINLSINFILIVYTQLVTFRQNVTDNILQNHSKKLAHFFLFILFTFCVGLGVEIIGVNTHKLFGDYSYSNVLGKKWLNVPVIIGVQWFSIIYSCGCIMSFVNNWATRKLTDLGAEDKSTKLGHSISLLIDASLLATAFDYILEPAAMKLNFWQWANNNIPWFNYSCWFIISATLLLVFNKLQFNKLNSFAIHLFIIQVLFFVAIRVYS